MPPGGVYLQAREIKKEASSLSRSASRISQNFTDAYPCVRSHEGEAYASPAQSAIKSQESEQGGEGDAERRSEP
jgi:hypothetical protein